MRIARFPNHEKIVTVERCLRHVLQKRRNNWLSNSRFTNAARSVLIRSPQLAASEGERILKRIRRSARFARQ